MYRGSSASDLVEDVTGEGLFDLSSAASRREIPTKNSRRKPEQPIPADYSVTYELRSWAKTRNLTVDLDHQTELFINHALQNDRRCRDWDAAWRNWMLKAQEFAARDLGDSRPGQRGRGHQPYKNPQDPSVYRKGLQ
jgi:hypothetical protein